MDEWGKRRDGQACKKKQTNTKKNQKYKNAKIYSQWDSVGRQTIKGIKEGRVYTTEQLNKELAL